MKRHVVLLSGAAALCLLACAPSAGAQVLTDAKQAPQELYIVNAGSASLTPVRGRSRVYRLVLREASQRVVAFTDRPQRSARTLRLRSFARRWATYGFDRQPPNVAMEVLDASRNADVFVFSMGRPRYDRRRGRLTMQVRHDPGQEVHGRGLARLDRRADRRLPTRVGRVALFVDGSTREQVTVRVVNGTEAVMNVDLAQDYAEWGSVLVAPAPGPVFPSETRAAKVEALGPKSDFTSNNDARLGLRGVMIGDDGVTPIANFYLRFKAPAGFSNNDCYLAYTNGWNLAVSGFTKKGNVDVTVTVLQQPNGSHPTSRGCL